VFFGILLTVLIVLLAIAILVLIISYSIRLVGKNKSHGKSSTNQPPVKAAETESLSQKPDDLEKPAPKP